MHTFPDATLPFTATLPHSGFGPRLTPTVTYLLMIIGPPPFLFTPILGAWLAYRAKRDAPDWLRGHYLFQIRTFWIGLVMSLLAVATILFIDQPGTGVIAGAIWGLVLIVGALAVNETRRGLIEARIDSLTTQGELIADVIEESATQGSPEPALEPALARDVLQLLFIPRSQRVRLFDSHGEVVADSQLVADRVEQHELPPARRPGPAHEVDVRGAGLVAVAEYRRAGGRHQERPGLLAPHRPLAEVEQYALRSVVGRMVALRHVRRRPRVDVVVLDDLARGQCGERGLAGADNHRVVDRGHRRPVRPSWPRGSARSYGLGDGRW